MRYLIGVGNYSMGDDGVGLRIVERIAQAGLDRGFAVVDLSGSGYDLLTYFQPETERIVLVDAVVTGGAPGSLVGFDPADAASEKILSRMTTHEGDLLQVIELGRSLGMTIPPIRILGIEPLRMEPGMELSPLLEAQLPAYIEAAIREVSG
jgi:hydrogenase maturation protease